MEPQNGPPGGASQRESPGLAAWVKEVIEADRRKWGGMTLGAHARLGLAELREAASLQSGSEAATPLGMWGTMTPGEVGAARQDGPQRGPLEDEPENAPPSPGDIAYGREGGSVYGPTAQPGQDRGSVYGDRQPDAPLPSPSAIAKDQQRDLPARQDRDLGRGR